ncbi:hypothetical protein ACI01nite_03680 [Acetobacter cibinongensis]|uniref:Glycosyltransferase 61 catalytic domain-containing protein n=1 Tax=Acetobacter cibinongensis TaxID=146475 RepID=A0A0D6N6P2_9PROT|nr:glycosyltransferase 61 family protein [Acetobacter cibinongensis]GAN61340.1 hypothetical protein Abci_018_210 [Acetobacter cibinongensis]GBQ16957.1 hypothetical protein AA0482_1741 [Acetobacter cibinongensis NRIC 0482]GEL57766.1 hypothetical protein ACI01nite_03680 [Acetobacter cibinongensis]
MIIPSPLLPFKGANFYSLPEVSTFKDAIYECGLGHFDGLSGLFTKEGYLINQAAFFHHHPSETKGQPSWINPQSAKTYPVIETAIFAGHLHEQYGHYITEFLSRIWFLKKLNIKAPILVRSFKDLNEIFSYQWARDLFSLLGLEKKDFLCPDSPLRIKELLVPDALFAEQGYCYQHMAEFCHELGDMALSHLSEETITKNKNIYLSRSDLICGTIKIDNEKEFENELSKLGFLILHPEKLSIYEQISLFRNNNIVVGVLGSAFHTSIFTPAPEGVAINMKDFPDINYLAMDGINSSRIDYVVYDGLAPSTAPDYNFYATKTIRKPHQAASDIYEFVSKKREKFFIPNMGKRSTGYEVNSRFYKIKTRENYYVKIDSRTGNVCVDENKFTHDAVLFELDKKYNFLLSNHENITNVSLMGVAHSGPALSLTVFHNTDGKISLYDPNLDKYVCSLPRDQGGHLKCDAKKILPWEIYSLEKIEKKEISNSVDIICSIIALVFSNESWGNADYYINKYRDIFCYVYYLKNNNINENMLNYSSKINGYLAISSRNNTILQGKIITHRGAIGDVKTNDLIDTGQTFQSSIEGINITTFDTNYTLKYTVFVKDESWSEWTSEGEFAGTTGAGKTLSGYSAKLFDKNGQEISIVCHAKFMNDDKIYSYAGGSLFTSPHVSDLIGISICFA